MISTSRGFRAVGRWDAPAGDALGRLVAEGAPFALSVTTPRRAAFRDVYFDTPDGVLLAHDVSCLVRYDHSGGARLFVAHGFDGASDIPTSDSKSHDKEVPVAQALRGDGASMRVLSPVVDPESLAPWLELETVRESVTAASRHWWKRSAYHLACDTVTVRGSGLSSTFHEVALHVAREGRPAVVDVVDALAEHLGLRASTVERRVRGFQVRQALEMEASARRVSEGGRVAVVALDGSRVAAVRDAAGWRLPLLEGRGEHTARLLLQRVLGTTGGEVRLVSTAGGGGESLPVLEVWSCTGLDRSALSVGRGAVAWLPIEEMLAHIGSREVHDAATLAALTSLAHTDALRWLVALPPSGTDRPSVRQTEASRIAVPCTVSPIDGDASQLAFNERVLALATDAATPLLERLRYVAIVAANIDEFVSVRLGRLKFGSRADRAGADCAHDDEGRVRDRMRQVGDRVAALASAQQGALQGALMGLRAHGIRVERLQSLSRDEQLQVHARFRGEVYPLLTPRALTAQPGHGRGVVGDRTLHLAVALRDPATGLRQLSVLAVPASVPRFLFLAGDTICVAIEDVMKQHVGLLYPGRGVEGTYAFRVTRFADMELDERAAGSLLHAVDEHARRRARRPIVRVDVESTMPRSIRRLLLRELALAPHARPGMLGEGDVAEVHGLLDLGGLRQLADLPRAELRFGAVHPRDPFAVAENLWDAIRREDALVHHPYDDFSTTVVRFFETAADDPDVVAIKVSLYRTGESSPIAEALRRAALAGKEVSVFVELRARFDEERNVRWTRRLEEAGAHVVHGVPGLKTHAKVALVVRREADGPRRYAHIGTGNYNAATSRLYTDLGVFTSREEVCDDVSDLFNALTAGVAPVGIDFRACLVAPGSLNAGLLERIEREASHARAGRAARIRMQVNGVADPVLVEALYDASRAGVDIDLVVRGLCTLRPGVAGHSDRIRVVSLVGRYLEHARIYSFANGGEPEYYIGSADLRARNLRRRVEVLVPVSDARHRDRLDAMIDAACIDPTRWMLGEDGCYTRPAGGVSWSEDSAQARHSLGVLQAPGAGL